MSKIRKAIILAAGEGKRLRPITENKPKCLVEINGKSLLSHQISILNILIEPKHTKLSISRNNKRHF